MRIKVAILYICTDKYSIFWKDFFDSYQRFFLPECEKEYFVFTDSPSIYMDECDCVHRIYQEPLGWPNNTLMRFHIFRQCFEKLKRYDYVFFMNANCECMCTITAEEFLPLDKKLLVVQHPGFFDKTPIEYTYDRNIHSTAFIPIGEGNCYICGGVNGGESEAFVKLMETLIDEIDMNNKNGVIAVWHDESHINHYILNRDDYRMLSPAYCYPEGWKIPFEEKIRIRNKSKYIDVDRIKKNRGDGGWLFRVLRKIQLLIG